MARWTVAAVVVVAALLAPAGPAAAADPLCLTSAPGDLQPPRSPVALRFGITPDLAGSAGAVQGPVAPQDPVRTEAALGRLAVPGRALVLRLNRLFSSDGRAGIDRFAARVDRLAALGFQAEVQLRYHPAPAQDGDMADWQRFVESATAELARRRAVVALSVTNEVNLPVSPNTSDGSYRRALDAIPVGVVAARRVADGLGRRDLAVGFTYAWRWLPTADLAFWRGLGARSTPAFRRSLDWVGLQAYPGLFWPPARLPGRTPGDELTEALAVLRHCYLPLAGIGRSTALWVSENGYSTGPGRRTPPGQAADLVASVEAVSRVSGTLGVTDYRWFNLRDNQSAGTDLFAAVGLLRDDYSEKPAFGAYRTLIARLGAAAPCLGRRGRFGRRSLGGVRVEDRSGARRVADPAVLLALGARRSALRRRLGAPARSRGRTDRWCVTGGGSLRARFDARGRAVLLATDARGYRAGRLAPGTRSAAARRLLAPALRVGRGVLRRRGSRLVAVLRRGRVRSLAVVSGRLARRPGALRRALRAAGAG